MVAFQILLGSGLATYDPTTSTSQPHNLTTSDMEHDADDLRVLRIQIHPSRSNRGLNSARIQANFRNALQWRETQSLDVLVNKLTITRHTHIEGTQCRSNSRREKDRESSCMPWNGRTSSSSTLISTSSILCVA
jgi:hypothetical protein